MIDARQKRQWLNNARQTLTSRRNLPFLLMYLGGTESMCVSLERLRNEAAIHGLRDELEELALAILAEQKL